MSSSAPTSPFPRAGAPLTDLLAQVFGHPCFRANQEPVCRAAITGHDVLLVMPTGAGKSLCYQLPAVARGGTALVISPLIALMEDQATKLSALGLRVARIHSGLDRARAREACADYLNGRLQFLFIAPERLRVPGFPEMLAKRKPSLIAIDEAHCISQWGHDFRPDYRTLGQHLPLLRPAPVMALTATATPVVQNDIVTQLQLGSPERFIHGFRRDNLAIEVVEMAKPRRHGFVAELLRAPERRPAIVYAPTRKDAEALALELGGHFPAAAYHAGLDPDHRERVQRHFLSGTLEAVVATIAFGMGIDKADVRTVVHTALPASLEAYYPEIGRAGRDGKPSRTVLLHSWADRRTHEFFLERDYPKLNNLDRIYRLLRSEPQHKDALHSRLDLDTDVFHTALEKLAVHGAAAIDYAGNIALGGRRDWREPYAAQSAHRLAQLDLVMRYAESSACRMCSLILHFGDTADGRRPCGHCDICSPERAVAQSFRDPTEQEQQAIQGLLKTLRRHPSMSTGKLHKELFPREDLSRNDFEKLLVALAAAGYLAVEESSFEKDGRSIAYKKVSLTRDGEDLREGERLHLPIRAALADTAERSSRKPRTQRSAARGRTARGQSPADAALAVVIEERLRAWRSAEAKRRGFPAYRIFSDKTLRAIAEDRPATRESLLAVEGMGPAKTEAFGEDICRICAEGEPPS